MKPETVSTEIIFAPLLDDITTAELADVVSAFIGRKPMPRSLYDTLSAGAKRHFQHVSLVKLIEGEDEGT